MRISGVTYVTRKTNKMRYIVTSITVVLLLAFASLVVISAYSGWQLLHPKKKQIEAFSSNTVPEYTNVSFTGTDRSIKLYGWYFKAKTSDRTVILAHSYGSNRMQFGNDTLNMVKNLLAKDYNVLAFDLRNSGKSGGKMSTLGCMEKDDISSAIKWSASHGSSRIILMGFSTGASASILAAAENKNVEAVIADSPYSDLKSYLNDNLNKWTHLPAFPFNKTILYSMELFSGIKADKANPLKAISKATQCKFLFIHGKNNRVVPAENSRELAKAAGASSDLWENDSSGIVSSYTEMPQEYMQRVLNFLDSIYGK